MALFLASAAGSSLAVLAGLRTRRRMFSSTSSTGLSAFLKRTKQSLFGGQSPSSSRRVHLVMGNEACDLDSLVSALVVAYMLEQSGPSFPLRAALATGKNPGQKEDGGQYQHDIFVPVVNIPRTPAVPGSRADIALRKDALGALAAAGVAPEDLLFVDDVDGLLDGLIAEDRLRVFLTDHNALASHQQSRAGLAAAVEGLIDHHKDEGKHPKDQVAYHNLEMVGSACTLVGELLQGADAPQTVAGDPTVARLLASVVLLDTANFDSDSKKFLPKDISVGRWLLDRAGKAEGDAEQQTATAAALYDELLAARIDTSGFTAEEFMRKDYKEWIVLPPQNAVAAVAGAAGSARAGYRFGVASVPVSLADWEKACGADGVLEGVHSTGKVRNLDLVVVMLAFSAEDTGAFCRQLLVHGSDRRLADAAVQFLVVSDLDLKKVDHSAGLQGGGVLVFEQRNVKASRKRVAPLLREFFELMIFSSSI